MPDLPNTSPAHLFLTMFVQRQFQKYQKRSADEQHVSVLLADFEDADQLLGRVRPPSMC